MKYHLYYLIIAIAVISLQANAQSKFKDSKGKPLDTLKMINQAADTASTGAKEDVLTDYLQLAAKSITNSNSGLQLKLNWFALNTNPDRYQYDNYFKYSWQRNGEFVGFAGAKSWQAGFNFNLLNHRDTTAVLYKAAYVPYDNEEGPIMQHTEDIFNPQVEAVVHAKLLTLVSDLYSAGKPINDMKTKIDEAIPGLFTGEPSDPKYAALLQNSLNAALAQVPHNHELPAPLTDAIHTVTVVLADEAVYKLVNDYGKGNLNTGSFANFISPDQITKIKKSLDDQVKNNKVLSGDLGAQTLPEVVQKIKAKYENLVSYVARQPLLTIGYLYNGANGTGPIYHQAGFTYLMSVGSAVSTHVGQLKASLTDTLGNSATGSITKNFSRNIIALQAGYNQVLIVYNKASMAEINGALEEDRATSGYIANTATSKFYLDAYLRVRLPSTPWLKLDLKYDPKGGKVLGLLDFTYNLGQ